MIRLALDTSTEAFSVAVENEASNEVSKEFAIAPRKHGELLIPTVDKLLSSLKLSVNQIEQVVYGRGPGAFTGIRIAISAAQGLAMGIDCPLIGISSLQNLALQAFERSSHQVCIVAMDARMGEVYCAVFKRCEDILEGNYPKLLGIEQVAAPGNLMVAEFDTHQPVVTIGSGWDVYASELNRQFGVSDTEHIEGRFPDAETNVKLARVPEIQMTAHSAQQAVPVYLRNNVAEKSSKPSVMHRQS